MAFNQKERLIRMSFLLNGFLFVLGALELITSGRVPFGLFQGGIAVMNFLLYSKGREAITKKLLTYGILIANIVVYLTTVSEKVNAGKQLVQYAWLIAAIMTTVALIVYIFGGNQKKDD